MINQNKQIINIEDADLSRRTENCLRQLKIKTINELTLLNKRYLLKQRGFGRRSIAELEHVLNKYNLCFEVEDKGGRPKIEFDLKQVEGLGAIQATYDDMAAVLGCSRDTIIRRMEKDEDGFATLFKKGMAHGKVSLRRLQWNAARGGYNADAFLTDLKQLIKHAEKDKIPVSELQTVISRWEKTHKSGNTTMQIWLGKQWLGQQDKTALEHSGSGVPIQTENVAITKEMSAKEAARIYARMIKDGNGDG